MMTKQLLSDLRITNGDGMPKLFREYLADFNILTIRRVPEPSHGPATKLLQRLLAENRDDGDVTVRGFDIRTPDRPCETCQGPHIVYTGPDLATICDSDGSILRQFGVVGYDRFFVVRSVLQVFDAGSIEEFSRPEYFSTGDNPASQNLNTRSPPEDDVTRHRVQRNNPLVSCV